MEEQKSPKILINKAPWSWTRRAFEEYYITQLVQSNFHETK